MRSSRSRRARSTTTGDPALSITSVANQRVKDAAALQRKKERDASGRYLVEGPNAVAEAAAEGVVGTIFATEEHVERYRDHAGIEVVEVADHVLERIATSRTPQGVVAVAEQRPADLTEVVGRGFLVVCHEVADPGNAGAIVRTADASGAAAVVVTAGSVDPYNPKAVRASAGSIVHLPIVTGVAIGDVLAACRRSGQRVLALDTSGDRSIEDRELLAPPVALLFGSEAHGLSRGTLEEADAVVSVPRYGRAESLNLAAAVAVAAYAVARVHHGGRHAQARPAGRAREQS